MVSSRVGRASLVRTSLLLLAAQVVLRLTDAGLPILLASLFGRSRATDVYFFAWAAFAFAGAIVFSAYQDSAIVPILGEVRLLAPQTMDAVVGAFIGHTVVFGGMLSLAIGGLAMAVLGLRYDGAELALAAKMVPLFSACLLATSLKTFYGAVLSAHMRFFAAPVASAAGTLLTLAVVFLGRGAGVGIVPAATLAGELLAATVLAWVVHGLLRIPLRPSLARPEPVRRFARLAAPEVGGGALTRINPAVDQMVCGLAGVVGGGTMLRFSGDLSAVPTSLLSASVLGVLLSHLSEDFGRGDLARARRTVRSTLLVSTLLLAAAAGAMHVARVPLLRLAFLHGEMDAAGIDAMAEILPYHLVGLPGFGALLVLARAHVASQNGRIMLGMGVLNATTNALFDFALVGPLGLRGVALATSLVHLGVALVFWVRLERRFRVLARSESRSRPTPRTERASAPHC
jgi:putative peptidoglycan lipid II flippase